MVSQYHLLTSKLTIWHKLLAVHPCIQLYQVCFNSSHLYDTHYNIVLFSDSYTHQPFVSRDHNQDRGSQATRLPILTAGIIKYCKHGILSSSGYFQNKQPELVFNCGVLTFIGYSQMHVTNINIMVACRCVEMYS